MRVLGGGVITAGGNNSLGVGLYQDTPLEKLLPGSNGSDSSLPWEIKVHANWLL